ncbi:MAG: hypothetical protein Q7T89_05305 [Anaerolineales bacterium]|nr:hypothetical protein [Anaerolineales bacterium]
MDDMIFRGRLDGRQRNKLKGLFDMMYTPRELAQEICIHVNQVYSVYIPLGCPLERDQRNHILINGKAFSGWYSSVYVKLRLKEDETFCKSCKQGVKIFQPKEKTKGGLVYVLSVCPHCGRNLTKILSNDK